MKQCSECQGFVPAGLQACPNCQPLQRPSLGRRLRLGSQLLLGASVTMTLSACYGMAPPQPSPCGSVPIKGSDYQSPLPCPSPSASASSSASGSPTASPNASASPAVEQSTSPSSSPSSSPLPSPSASPLNF